jgi:hypothetical protein
LWHQHKVAVQFSISCCNKNCWILMFRHRTRYYWNFVFQTFGQGPWALLLWPLTTKSWCAGSTITAR